MKKTPYFSVIVPMYNVQRYIKLCIDSILNQTFKDFEIIIVDDASPDDSYKICHERYGKNEKVRIIRHEKNQGLGSSRNTGIKNARGKYIYFVDSDDLIMKDTLEKIYAVAEKTNADVIRTAGHFVTYQDDEKPIEVSKMKTVWDTYNTEGLLKDDKYYRLMEHYYTPRNFTTAWLCCYKRDFFLKHSIKFESIISEDELFTIEIYCFAEKYYVMHSAFYVYRRHSGTIMTSYNHDRVKKAIAALPIIENKLNKILPNVKQFAESNVARKRFVKRILSGMVETHIKPLYNNFNEELDSTIQESLLPIFGESTGLAQYLLDDLNITARKADEFKQKNLQLTRQLQQAGKQNADSTDKLLASQNNLLEKMNGLIEQQNKIIQSQTSTSQEVFVKDLYHDEIRDGFLVTSHRKKLWNVQIGLINEFARICKKYNLHWFAYGGTLLGAARHKGFVPWDDDVDVAMFRPDYEKFKQVAADEIKYPYFFDNWYNHRRESDVTPDTETQFPFLTRANEARYFGMGSFPTFPVIKLRDSRTTMIEFPDRKNANQGIWIDILPLDMAPPLTSKKDADNFEIARELLTATSYPEIIRNTMKANQPLKITYDSLNQFLKLPYRQRGAYFDSFMLKNFSPTENMDQFRLYRTGKDKPIAYPFKDTEKVIYMPFEQIEIPVPAGWENCLKSQYGDWQRPLIYPSHTRDYFYSAEISYTEYYKNSLL